MSCIDIIKASRESHIAWIDYYKKYPWTETMPENKAVGDIAFHEERVADYAISLSEIKQLQTENKRLRTDRDITERSFVAAKKVCEIYFTIAADAIGPDEVRKQRDLALKEGEK